MGAPRDQSDRHGSPQGHAVWMRLWGVFVSLVHAPFFYLSDCDVWTSLGLFLLLLVLGRSFLHEREKRKGVEDLIVLMLVRGVRLGATVTILVRVGSGRAT